MEKANSNCYLEKLGNYPFSKSVIVSVIFGDKNILFVF